MLRVGAACSGLEPGLVNDLNVRFTLREHGVTQLQLALVFSDVDVGGGYFVGAAKVRVAGKRLALIDDMYRDPCRIGSDRILVEVEPRSAVAVVVLGERPFL